MLPTSVTANLDYLASLGVLDYDAAADIAGTKPRYYGSPQYYVPPAVMTPMDTISFSKSSGSNPFVSGSTASTGQPLWKTIGSWILGLGALYLGGKVFLNVAKGVKSFSFKNLFSRGKKAAENVEKEVEKGLQKGKKKFSQATNHFTLGNKPWYKKVGSSISEGWNKFTGLFSRNKSRIRLRG